MKQTRTKTIYPWLYLLSAVIGTVCIFAPVQNLPVLMGSTLLLPIAILAANVFSAAWVVSSTEIQTISRPNPRARFFENEPQTVETNVYRIPLIPVLLSLLGALVSGLLTGSPIVGLIVLFLWGMLSYPLALCILYRNEFALSMQTGLISATVFTAIAGVIQVFISSPGNRFQLKYCYDAFIFKLRNFLIGTINEAMTVPPEDGFTVADQMKGINIPELVDSFITSLVSLSPAIFAIVVLAVLCIIWWLTKAALKRGTDVDVKYMGRIDGYTPSRITSVLYLIFFFVYFFGTEGSGWQLAGLNVFYVVSAVLTFAGFSFVLYMINTHAPSRAARIVLTVGAILVGSSSCGGQLLILAGLMSAGNDLRARFGGGTLK